MDDISRGVGAALEAVKEIPSWLDRILTTLDKHHLLPMPDWRKKNYRDKVELDLEMEGHRCAFQRAMDLADAELRSHMALMGGSPQLALEAMEKDLAQGVSFKEASQRYLPLAVRATANLYRETLQCEYAKERIGLYALQAAAENPDAKCAEGEVSETWNAQFWDYAKNIRDEEAMRQWGRLLAEEIKSPGKISIKVLDTLRSLNPERAKDFHELQKYAMTRLIPLKAPTNENLKIFGINCYRLSLLESNSLIIGNISYYAPKDTQLENRFYRIIIPAGTEFSCLTLTDIGNELNSLSDNSEEDALAGAMYFADYLKKYNSITVEIEKISDQANEQVFRLDEE